MAKCELNLNLHADGYAQTSVLAGRAVSLEYASGHTLEQHWQTQDRIKWKGVAGSLAGYSQYETYRAFEIASGIVLICWTEGSTTATADGDQVDGPWLTDVVLDFNTMRAMASWTGPTEGGGSEHVLDQARMTEIELDPS